MELAYPVYTVALHVTFAYLALILCSISFFAIIRTKRTPYSTKILSICLLIFDCSFLICSSTAKLFKYKDIYVVQQAARGFQSSSNIIILGMAFERVFALNWPYIYIKVVTKRRTRLTCIAVCLFAVLQYVVVRGLGCYARGRFVDCGMVLQVYFVLLTITLPLLSFICYYKIYTIVRQKGSQQNPKYSLSQYKGTMVSFIYLINASFSIIVYVGMAVFYTVRTSQGVKEDGLVAIYTDSLNIIDCLVDPLIYVVYFRETRFEILKMLETFCPFLKSRTENVRLEIFDITTTYFLSGS